MDEDEAVSVSGIESDARDAVSELPDHHDGSSPLAFERATWKDSKAPPDARESDRPRQLTASQRTESACRLVSLRAFLSDSNRACTATFLSAT